MLYASQETGTRKTSAVLSRTLPRGQQQNNGFLMTLIMQAIPGQNGTADSMGQRPGHTGLSLALVTQEAI